jgi:hypothetical protein
MITPDCLREITLVAVSGIVVKMILHKQFPQQGVVVLLISFSWSVGVKLFNGLRFSKP